MTDGQGPEVCPESGNLEVRTEESDKPKPKRKRKLASPEAKMRMYDALTKYPRSFAPTAAKLNISTTLLSRWLRDKTGSPRIEGQVPQLRAIIKELRQTKGAFLPPKKRPRMRPERKRQTSREATERTLKAWASLTPEERTARGAAISAGVRRAKKAAAANNTERGGCGN